MDLKRSAMKGLHSSRAYDCDICIKLNEYPISCFLKHITIIQQEIMYSLPKLTLDWLIFAKTFVIFVRFRGVLRPWSPFYREYEDNVNK